MQTSRKVLLAVCSVVFIVLFFSVDFYKDWIGERVITPAQQIPEQMAYLDAEERKGFRWGSSYMVCKNISDYLTKMHKDKRAIVLLPPKGYIDSCRADFPVPEPVVFYYYTGLRGKWINSAGVDSANCAVIFNGKDLALMPVDKEQLKVVLDKYRRYKLSL